MEAIKLKATTREVLGKKTRFLRRKGITPTHLFGHNIKSRALECPTTALERILARAGTTRLINLQIDDEKRPQMVLIREIQKDPISGQLLHIDFYQVKMSQKMSAEVPIVIVGEAPALKGRGRVLIHPLSHLTVESLPDKLPPRIEVDISSLEELHNAIHVSDITLDAEVTVTTDPEQMVAKVGEVAAAKVEEAEEEAALAAEAEAAAEEGAEEAAEATEEETKPTSS